MQLVKCCLLENSNDESIRAIYESKRARAMNFARRKSVYNLIVRWSMIFVLDLRIIKLVSDQEITLQKLSVKEIRQKVGNQLEEDLVRHLICRG